MFLQVWKKARPWDRLSWLFQEKKNVIVGNEDVTHSSEPAFLLFCASLKAICSPKPKSIFSAQVISWLTHLQISLWIAFRINLRIIQMSNYSSQTLWLRTSPRMNFLNIWEKILNFVQVGSKFISFGNKEPQRVFAQSGLHWFYFVQQLQIWVTLGGLFGGCLCCGQFSVFGQFAVGFLWMAKWGRKERKEKERKKARKKETHVLSPPKCRTLGWCHLWISKYAALIAALCRRRMLPHLFSLLLQGSKARQPGFLSCRLCRSILAGKKAKPCLLEW